MNELICLVPLILKKKCKYYANYHTNNTWTSTFIGNLDYFFNKSELTYMYMD